MSGGGGDAARARAHHAPAATQYVYMESLNNPATDDLVIWFNGGEGTSPRRNTGAATRAPALL